MRRELGGLGKEEAIYRTLVRRWRLDRYLRGLRRWHASHRAESERGSRGSERQLSRPYGRMRISERASSDTLSLLEHIHGLAKIVERGV